MCLGSSWVVLCASSLLGLCLYALHKNAVTIDAFRVALFALRLLRWRPWVARACEYSLICLLGARCAKHSVVRVLRR